VRYTVDGEIVRSRVLLCRCVSNSCSFRQRTGDAVEIAYDPDKVTRAVRATAAPARPPGAREVTGSPVFGRGLGPSGPGSA
jgi:hypothetical protein